MMFSLLLAFVVGIADTCPTNGVPKAPQAYFEAVKAADATPRLLPATTNAQEIAKLFVDEVRRTGRPAKILFLDR